MDENLFYFVQEALAKCKGRWPSVAKESGLSYQTVVRIGNGNTKSPAYRTIQKLAMCLQRMTA